MIISMDVEYPTNNFDVNYAAEIVVVVDTHVSRGASTKSQLVKLGFAVIGPLFTLNEYVNELRTIDVKAIIYYLDSSLEVIFQFLDAITRFQTPIMLIGTIDPIINRKLDKLGNAVANISNTADETNLLSNLRVLIYGAASLPNEPLLIQFTNTTVAELLQLTPRERKSKVKRAVAYALTQLTQLETNIKALDLTNFVLTSIGDSSDLGKSLKAFVWTIIDVLDDNEKVPWGTAIMRDAVLQALFKFQPLSDELLLFTHSLNLGDLNMPLTRADFQMHNRFVTQTAFIALEDLGPEVIFRFNDDGTIFNSASASKLISLVGQGEMYHEGLFGPIPVSKTDIMSLIYSKLLTDDSIKDSRLQGQTLTLAAIAFHSSLVQQLPDRIRLQRIFDPFARITNIINMNEEILKQIDANFHKFF